VGTVFPLRQTVVAVTSSGSGEAGSVNNGGSTLTYNGGSSRVFTLAVPALGINTPVTLQATNQDTPNITTDSQFLVYSFLGYWQYVPSGASATDYFSAFITGFQTPASAVPTSGVATYATGTNGTSTKMEGNIFIPPSGVALSNLGATVGTIAGDASVTVNFATSAVNGSITNTVAKGGSSSFGYTWNNIGLTGTLSGATMSGTTAVTSTPAASSLTFDSSSTGTFSGALYGPHADELGITFTLHDPTGQGKTAIGAVIAPKQ
jgi:hypothetical protein